MKYVIEKVHTRDKTFVLKENDKKFLYKYPDDINDIRKKFKEENKKNTLYNFVFGCCWMIEDHDKNFPINIRYSGKQMENFFKLNRDRVGKDIIFNEEKRFYIWGRYIIHFQNEESENICLKLLVV